MQLTETASTSTAPITLTEALQQVRYFDSDRDDDINSKITAATDWAEKWTQRTLRQSVTRRLSMQGWWACPLALAWPPISAVTSVKYYDADNVDQTLATSQYHVLNDSDGTTRIVWADDVIAPSLYDRPDAVRIEYVTGYQDQSSVPEVVKQAVKLMVEVFMSQDDGRDLDRMEQRAKALLSTVEWPRYA